MRTYKYSDKYNRSESVRVLADGEEQFVFSTPSTDIAAFETDGAVTVEVVYEHDIKEASVRPLSKGMIPEINGNRLRVKLSGPDNILIDVKGERQLHIYANAPSDGSGYTRYYRAGQIYDEGEMVLKSGDSIYIEGGAVVRGSITAEGADNIKIAGGGVFDGSYFNDGRRLCVLYRCRNVDISGVIFVRPQRWMLMLHECSNVRVTGIKEVGEVISSDGIDVVGSSDVTIDGCFLRNNDDCVVVKAMPLDGDETRIVENIMVKNCVFLNDTSGNATEIGHELRCAKVKNVVFDNCDILSVHGYGAAFSIHNADCAEVRDILYRNIRVEHYYDKLVDLRVISSMWGRHGGKGRINNIRFENIRVTALDCNSGYSVSLIGGYDAEHRVSNVVFDGFYINDRRIKNGNELDLFMKEADGIVFI